VLASYKTHNFVHRSHRIVACLLKQTNKVFSWGAKLLQKQFRGFLWPRDQNTYHKWNQITKSQLKSVDFKEIKKITLKLLWFQILYELWNSLKILVVASNNKIFKGMETDFFKFTTMASKEDINVFHRIFIEFNVLFDQAHQKYYFHTF